jgi:predicted kinase
MRRTYLLLVTGPPASGKSTLAQQLGPALHLPVIAKDTVKEPLFATLPAVSSRALSDAAFAVMFAVARELLADDVSALLEGNFRAEHAASLQATFPPGVPAHIVQVLCSAPLEVRQARLAARAHDPQRHPAHADAAHDAQQDGEQFLDLPGARFVSRSSAPGGMAELLREVTSVLEGGSAYG